MKNIFKVINLQHKNETVKNETVKNEKSTNLNKFKNNLKADDIDWKKPNNQKGEMYIHHIFKEQYKEALNSDFLNNMMKYADLNAERLYRFGKEAYDKGDMETSKKCETLNKIINNSIITSSCEIGQCTKLAYGGIGLVIHSHTIMGKYGMIGANVTIGAAPIIGDCVYISTGAKIVGLSVKIGCFSIIGANAVVNDSVPPFTIVGGIPAKKIGEITPDNIDKYLESYFAVGEKNNPVYVQRIRDLFMQQYSMYYPNQI